MHAAVQDVRGGPDAHRRHRRDHRTGGNLRDWSGSVTLHHGRALHQLAGAVPRHQDHRWQGDERQDQTRSQPYGPALRLAAAAQRSSQSALGAYFRRMCSRMDKPKAVTAAAHKLARLIYTMLTKGEEYTDQGQDYYEEHYHQRVLRQLAMALKKWA